MIKILVTGAGGGVGQGLIKALKLINDLPIKVVAADMSELAAGLYAGDSAYLVDRCDSTNYIRSLEKIFIAENIDYYIPGTDVELPFCSKNKSRIFNDYGVKTVISSQEAVDISNNKFKTYEFLKDNNFYYPKTEYLKDFQENMDIDYPLIVKPAIGCRSIGVHKIINKKELSNQKEFKKETDIVQELIGNDDSEYTCTVVKVNNSLISPVLPLKRELRAGDTFRAKPVKSKLIEDYIFQVVNSLDIEGAANFQLRIDSNGIPKIFEINCRFSGTTPFCAQLGFNPVEYYLKYDLGLKYEPIINYDLMVLRYWSEAVIKLNAIDELKIKKHLAPEKVKLDQFHLY